jgi:uncharacterized protein (UPF0332 family)
MIQANDLLSLAGQLSLAATEAEWRAAVSRAYYAGFHAARDLFRDLGFTVSQADQAHPYLSRRLQNCGVPSVQVAGVRLHRLRGDRNRADYELQTDVSDVDAKFNVIEARKCLQIMATAYTDPVRAQVITAIRAYEQQIQEPTYQGP